MSISKLDVLKKIRFGERIAEDELGQLEKYFVATDQWNRVYSGEVDVVYGPKGSGKSALYALIDKKQDALFDRKIILGNAENIRGSTAFADIISEPPPSERSFIALWKLYFLILTTSALRDFGISNSSSRELIAALERAELLPENGSLAQFFRAARRQIWGYLFPERESVEWTIALDPLTGTPLPIRRTTFRPSTKREDRPIEIPLDDLIGRADASLREAGYQLWIIFDRLDVAFNESPDLERNALRALFRMYNDFKGYDNIRLKIFVRDDIWERISEGGFAEASHITRTTSIEWTFEGLVNLFVRRLLNNTAAVDYLGVDASDVRDSFDRQLSLIQRIFPDKVETGKNPETFKWMMNRIQDGTGKPAPRELIHLLEQARQTQISRLERGEPEPSGDLLFDRAVFKIALREVSKVRYEQTFCAENPGLKSYTDKLKGAKAEQIPGTLSQIWGCSEADAATTAERLAKAGFFEVRESAHGPSFWVPFIYRDALELIQGKSFDERSDLGEDYEE